MPGTEQEELKKPLVNFWDDEDRGYYPDTVPRKCTDTCWVPIYLVFLALFIYVCEYAYSKNLLTHAWVPRDYKFRSCGEGVMAEKPPLDGFSGPSQT